MKRKSLFVASGVAAFIMSSAVILSSTVTTDTGVYNVINRAGSSINDALNSITNTFLELNMNTIEGHMDDKAYASRKSIGLTEDISTSIMEEQKGNYYFDRLPASQQKQYADIYYILTHRAKSVALVDAEESTLSKIFESVLADHPEIFYTTGYEIETTKFQENVLTLYINAKYVYTEEEIATRQKQIDVYVEDCIRGIPSQADDYEKSKYVYEYLIKYTDYDLAATDNQNICSVMIDHVSVCNGYAKSFQYIMKKLGIDCTVITGYVNNGESHAWNAVKLDSNYYYVDVTWGDSYYITPDTNQLNSPKVNYNFLNITTNELQRSHVIENLVAVPVCAATQNNYYVRENMYMDCFDEEQLTSIFNQAFSKGKDSVSIKFSDNDLYNAYISYLIDKQYIFEYLPSLQQATYSTDSSQNIITFWLS